jgi:Cu/Ag efflux protein CusF
MKSSHWLRVLAFAALLFAIGCQQSTTAEKPGPSAAPAAQEYDFKAKVLDVAADKQSVKLDHEAIPAIDMMAMKMNYRVESPNVLEGIKTGDQVKGRLKKAADGYVVTSLQKQ